MFRENNNRLFFFFLLQPKCYGGYTAVAQCPYRPALLTFGLKSPLMCKSVLCITRCLVTALAFTHQKPAVLLRAVATKNVNRHCQMSSEG